MLLACSAPETERAPAARSTSSPLLYEKLAAAERVLLRVGPLAEGSFYACLVNAISQGISEEDPNKSPPLVGRPKATRHARWY